MEIQHPLPALFTQIRESLAEVLAIAKSAEACAAEGYVDRALTIALDIEELINSTNHVLQAAAALNRSIKKSVVQMDVSD